MEEIILPILIAIVVGLLVWGVYAMLRATVLSEKRKIQERLSVEAAAAATRLHVPRVITLQREARGLSGALARLKLMEGLHRKLLQAYPDTTLLKFMGIVTWTGLGAFLLISFITDSLLLGFLAGLMGAYTPIFMLGRKRSTRQRLMSEQLPEALDFLSRILRAGHSFSTGLQMMGDELPQPLAGEFRRTYDQHSLGQALDEAMKDMATRVQSTDFAFFVTAVLIQRQTGGDLSEVLTNISDMIRQRIRLQQNVRAKTAEGRFTGYILVAFPVVMFFVTYALNPAYARKLLDEDEGRILLGVAIGLEMAGLYAIRRLTTVKV